MWQHGRGVLLVLLGLAGLGLMLEPGRNRGAAEQQAPADPLFQVPPGFVVEKIAGAPLVEHPVMACFDDKGRLYVAESAGLNLRAPDLLKQLPDSIRLLEDSTGDGRFDKFTVFADKMSFPQGVLWHDGAVYSCAPPSLWKLVDTNGDGVADQRQELVSKFHFIGNAADIHGPVLGPDGWLYWADGRHGHQIEQGDKVVSSGKAARIFHCRLDGSHVETVCGGGMDNPVEIAFTPEAEPFATVNLFFGQPRRLDAIIYCIEGGVFPYHPAYKELKQTGDLLPPTIPLGWVAPSGLMRYKSGAFGKEYQDNLFSSQFNTHKIQRHILERDGAGFKAKTEDFVVSTSPDFHPTDVLEDADGSLIVIDTGGWFRIGCPTSQIAKPDIKGGIYRVRKKDAPKVEDPRGLKEKWDTANAPAMARLLGDRRWVVRERAIHELAKNNEHLSSVWRELVETKAGAEGRRNLVWAVVRANGFNRLVLLMLMLEDADPSVRQAAAHGVGLLRLAEFSKKLCQVLHKDGPSLRSQAATALGRIHRSQPGTAVVPDLLEALKADNDRMLEHAILYALIEIKDRDQTLKGLADADPRVRRGALIVLDQLDTGILTPQQVVPLLDTPDPALQRTAWAIITSRPEWAKEVIGQLRTWLASTELPPGRQEMLRTALLGFCKDPAVQELAAQSLRSEKSPVALRLLILETMAQAPLDKLPPTWVAEVGRCLQVPDETLLSQAVATLRARNVADFDQALLRLAGDSKRTPELRVACLTAAAPRLAMLDPSLFDFLTSRLVPKLPPLTRLAAADAIGHCRLSDEQLETLAKVVASAGALEMSHLVAPYEHSKSPQVGQRLVAALEQSPGFTSLSPDVLTRTLKNYPPSIQQSARPLMKKLQVDTAAQKAKLDELEPVLKTGDPKRGRFVFFGVKAACATCHTVGTEGGKFGPDLTKIASIRAGRDLLEAVVFPSASFVRGFEPMIIATHDGRFHQGIIGREAADAVYLVNAERSETRIPRSAVESIDRGKVSIMPQGLDAQLTRQELGDLMQFLLTLK